MSKKLIIPDIKEIFFELKKATAFESLAPYFFTGKKDLKQKNTTGFNFQIKQTLR